MHCHSSDFKTPEEHAPQVKTSKDKTKVIETAIETKVTTETQVTRTEATVNVENIITNAKEKNSVNIEIMETKQPAQVKPQTKKEERLSNLLKSMEHVKINKVTAKSTNTNTTAKSDEAKKRALIEEVFNNARAQAENKAKVPKTSQSEQYQGLDQFVDAKIAKKEKVSFENKTNTNVNLDSVPASLIINRVKQNVPDLAFNEAKQKAHMLSDIKMKEEELKKKLFELKMKVEEKEAIKDQKTVKNMIREEKKRADDATKKKAIQQKKDEEEELKVEEERKTIAMLKAKRTAEEEDHKMKVKKIAEEKEQEIKAKKMVEEEERKIRSKKEGDVKRLENEKRKILEKEHLRKALDSKKASRILSTKKIEMPADIIVTKVAPKHSAKDNKKFDQKLTNDVPESEFKEMVRKSKMLEDIKKRELDLIQQLAKLKQKTEQKKRLQIKKESDLDSERFLAKLEPEVCIKEEPEEEEMDVQDQQYPTETMIVQKNIIRAAKNLKKEEEELETVEVGIIEKTDEDEQIMKVKEEVKQNTYELEIAEVNRKKRIQEDVFKKAEAEMQVKKTLEIAKQKEEDRKRFENEEKIKRAMAKIKDKEDLKKKLEEQRRLEKALADQKVKEAETAAEQEKKKQAKEAEIKRIEEENQKKIEAEMLRIAEEEIKRKVEEEAKRKALEDIQRKAIEESKKKALEEDKQKKLKLRKAREEAVRVIRKEMVMKKKQEEEIKKEDRHISEKEQKSAELLENIRHEVDKVAQEVEGVGGRLKKKSRKEIRRHLKEKVIIPKGVTQAEKLERIRQMEEEHAELKQRLEEMKRKQQEASRKTEQASEELNVEEKHTNLEDTSEESEGKISDDHKVSIETFDDPTVIISKDDDLVNESNKVNNDTLVVEENDHPGVEDPISMKSLESETLAYSTKSNEMKTIEATETRVEEIQASIDETITTAGEHVKSIEETLPSIEDTETSIEKTEPSIKEIESSTSETETSTKETEINNEETDTSVEKTEPNVNKTELINEETANSVEEKETSTNTPVPSVKENEFINEKIKPKVIEMESSMNSIVVDSAVVDFTNTVTQDLEEHKGVSDPTNAETWDESLLSCSNQSSSTFDNAQNRYFRESDKIHDSPIEILNEARKPTPLKAVQETEVKVSVTPVSSNEEMNSDEDGDENDATEITECDGEVQWKKVGRSSDVDWGNKDATQINHEAIVLDDIEISDDEDQSDDGSDSELEHYVSVNPNILNKKDENKKPPNTEVADSDEESDKEADDGDDGNQSSSAADSEEEEFDEDEEALKEKLEENGEEEMDIQNNDFEENYSEKDGEENEVGERKSAEEERMAEKNEQSEEEKLKNNKHFYEESVNKTHMEQPEDMEEWGDVEESKVDKLGESHLPREDSDSENEPSTSDLETDEEEEVKVQEMKKPHVLLRKPLKLWIDKYENEDETEMDDNGHDQTEKENKPETGEPQKESNVDKQIEKQVGPEVDGHEKGNGVEEQIRKEDKSESEVVQKVEEEREETDGGNYNVPEDENETEIDIPLEDLAEISEALFDLSEEPSDESAVTSIFDESPVKKESSENVAVKKETTEDVPVTEDHSKTAQVKQEYLHAISENETSESTAECGTSEIKAESEAKYDPLSEIEHKVEKLLAKENGSYKCLECDHVRPNKATVISHIESKHLKSAVICKLCNVTSTTRHALVMHMARKHPGQNKEKRWGNFAMLSSEVRKPLEEQKTM